MFAVALLLAASATCVATNRQATAAGKSRDDAPSGEEKSR